MIEVIERARQMVLNPKETWKTVKGENYTIQELVINYAAPLALIPAVATLFGLSIIGIRVPSGHIVRSPFMETLAAGVVGYLFHLLGLLAAGWFVHFLAPYFNARQDFVASVKLVIYAMTPVWLLGVFTALPGLGILQILGVYSIYLLYQGIGVVLDTPPEKVLWYTVLVLLSAVLISLILTVIVGSAVYGPMFMRMMSV